MLYELTLISGNTQITRIVKDPEFANGVLHCTLVGEFAGFGEYGSRTYASVPSRDYYAGGSLFVLEEYKGKF